MFKQKVKRIAEKGADSFTEKLMLPFLSLASLGYSLVVSVRNLFYSLGVARSKKLPFPVMSVGNVTWGGTGKTPFVKFLGTKINNIGKDLLVLTRGYSHDEVGELKKALHFAKVGVGKDRYKAAMDVVEQPLPHIAILDDGFQHRKLEKDIEIVLINGCCPFGSGHLIPLGSLREPLNKLKKADMVVITHADQMKDGVEENIRKTLKQSGFTGDVLKAEHVAVHLTRCSSQERIDLEFLRSKTAGCLSAIGSPESFYHKVETLGAKIKKKYEFLDHHDFSLNELRKIQRDRASGLFEEIVITEKDYSRLPEMITSILDPLVLVIELKLISGEDVLDDRLHRLLHH